MKRYGVVFSAGARQFLRRAGLVCPSSILLGLPNAHWSVGRSTGFLRRVQRSIRVGKRIVDATKPTITDEATVGKGNIAHSHLVGAVQDQRVRSYSPTDNLTIISTGKGITMAASDVQLDLNGFTISGTTGHVAGTLLAARRPTSPWTMAPCVIAETTAINADAATQSRFCDLTRAWNGLNFAGKGLRAGGRALVPSCIFVTNNASGVRLAVNSARWGSVVLNNRSGGASLSQYGTVPHFLAIGNDIVGTGNYVLHNTCSSGFFARGIEATGSRNRIEANHVGAFGTGIRATSFSNLIVGNSVFSHTNFFFTNPQIFGPTNNLVGPGGVITNENPWANFSL